MLYAVEDSVVFQSNGCSRCGGFRIRFGVLNEYQRKMLCWMCRKSVEEKRIESLVVEN